MTAWLQAVFQLMTDCKSRLRIAVLEDCTEGAQRRLTALRDPDDATTLALESADLTAGGRRLQGLPAEAWPGLAEGLRDMGSEALQQLWQGQQLKGLNTTWHWQ